MREGRAIPHTDLKQGGSSPFFSSAHLPFQIGAPATGREGTENSTTSPHQSFQIRVTPFKLLLGKNPSHAEASPCRPLWNLPPATITRYIHIGRFSLSCHLFNIFWWHILCQPHIITRKPKRISIFPHRLRHNFQNYNFASPSTSHL